MNAKLKIALALLPCLQACSGTGAANEQTFAITPDVAFTRLKAADMVGFRNGSSCGMLLHFRAREEAGRAITWTVSSSGWRVAEFTVRLEPNGSGTIARIELPKAPDGVELYSGGQSYNHPVLIQPIRPNIEELVVAAMEQRPFDVHRVTDPETPDSMCISLANNFEASGQPYRIDDPMGMTHADAMEARSKGIVLEVRRDPWVTREHVNPWSH